MRAVLLMVQRMVMFGVQGQREEQHESHKQRVL